MSGIDVVACVAGIVAAFQGGADAMRRIQLVGKRKKKPEFRVLEDELQKSMERARDEVTRNKEMFIGDCGYTVPGEGEYSQRPGDRSSQY